MAAASSSLWQARSTASPVPPLTETYPGITVPEAYAISRLGFERRLNSGAQSIGRKIGLTSLAVQKQLGVSEPDFGYLTSDMRIEDGGDVQKGALIQGRVEGEVAFILGRDLKGPGVTFGQVLAATDHVVACVEIIDSRVLDWKIKIADTIADNASSAMLVLGKTKRKLGDFDMRMAGMTLRKNGEVESTGVGAACMDHPVLAVAWLANRLGELGDGLKAGDIVLSGAYGPVVPFLPGDRCEVEISGLGIVRCGYAA